YGFGEICRRRGDFAIAAVGCIARIDDTGKCIGASIAVGGAHPVPLLIPQAQENVLGSSGAADAIAEAAEIAAATVDPGSDHHASADFRRRLVRALTIHALRECFRPPEEIERAANESSRQAQFSW